MDKEQEFMKAAQDQLGKMLHQLESGSTLSEKDCQLGDQYLTEMASKTAKAIEPKQKQIPEGGTCVDIDIDELLRQFENLAGSSTQKLQNLLGIISEGRVPEAAEMTTLDTSIEELRKSYASIYNLAAQQLPPEEMPPENMPVGDYAHAVANSAKVKYAKLLEAIRETLEQFVAVRSLVEQCAAALAPYQKQAADLIRNLHAENEQELEDIKAKAKAPGTFLEAISCENFFSPEGQALYNELNLQFKDAPFVPMGVMQKAYTVDEAVLAELRLAQGTAETDSKELSGSVSVPVPVEEDTPAPVVEDVPCIPAAEEILPEIQEDADAAENEPEERSAFAKAVEESGFLINNQLFPEFSVEVSDAENKKIGSSIFVNDMRKGSLPSEKEILHYSNTFPILHAQDICAHNSAPIDAIQASLDYMHKKGYFKKYTSDKLGTFYEPTNRLATGLSYKDGCKFMGIRQKRWPSPTLGSTPCITAAICRLHLSADSANRFHAKGYSDISSTSRIAGTTFISCDFPDDPTGIHDLTLGAFWTEVTDCTFLAENINEILPCKEGPSNLIFASIDMEHAKAFAGMCYDFFDLPTKDTSSYLYSFQDQAYYTYPELKKTEVTVAGITSQPETGSESAEDVLSQQEESEACSLEVSDAEDPNQKAEETSPGIAEMSPEKHDRSSFGTSETVPSASILAPENDLQVIYKLLAEKKFYAAVAYAKACASGSDELAQTYKRLAYALNDPMMHCRYTTGNIFELLSDEDFFSSAMDVAMSLRFFFTNHVQYDYNTKSLYEGIKNTELLGKFPALSKVVYTLADFKAKLHRGMDAYAGYRAKDQKILESEITKVRTEAKIFYENFILARKSERASVRRFLETKKLLFSVDGDVGTFIKSVVDGDMESLPLVEAFLRETFFKEDSSIAVDTIDNDMLWSYIEGFWELAGEHMMIHRSNVDLKSRLRTNIISMTTRAVQLLVRWYILASQISTKAEDAASIDYRKLHGPLLENIREAEQELQSAAEGEHLPIADIAGLHIIQATLEELRQCIDGSFNERTRKYFYAPFLLSDDMPLDENFCPEFDMFGSEVDELQPRNRIMSHIQKLQSGTITYSDRLNYNLADNGDDLGTAKLIVEYLTDMGTDLDLRKSTEDIIGGEGFAQENANLRRDNFIGELELAQSYGQIDNSNEDVKEKILQIVDSWYTWAIESGDYGFFKKVLDAYLREIKRKAKPREEALLEQLKAFRETHIQGLSPEEKNQRVERIASVIKSQNYTVAEELIRRAHSQDEDTEDMVGPDYLNDFLSHYDDFYAPVSVKNSSFSMLVSSRTRNKEQRAAKRLADNWLPGGSNLGQERLSGLLAGLGFTVATIKPQLPIGKFENYVVHTVKAQSGSQAHYTHPIAAFGSGAAQDGFRVVCMNGTYDADSLISIMQQIGNTKHTLILLDYALPKSERRLLARKCKSMLGDKLFAVLDRTMMMYLVRNYDETKINRMLVSLITPFGCYQPYVWESANVMPPEIFIGRKRELESIKSPTGANIVYGGRQLGKSALLKKAKEDIDYNENGDRAVYIEIKGLNYMQAAQKIAYELFDQFILDQEMDNPDWDQLARAIKKRLQSQNEKIPYLLLLLDEADVFIESCESVNYKPFDALKEIQNIGAGRFKFVVAGLRNVVKFKRDAALGNNSVLTHLESMTVRPFEYSEAKELMTLPLYYLGLRFPQEKESLVTLILATTNYFPGMIQLYCAKLLEAMRHKDYAGYDEVDTPVYEVNEKHIKKVLADHEFTDQIREKFFITLKLDEDNYYYLIALIIAYLYHNNGYNTGYTAEEIKSASDEYGIRKISALDTQKLSVLLEELLDLNVLRSPDDGVHYLFARYTFFQMMGTKSEVDDKLMPFMEG